jgi:hypothetical protein
VFDSTRDASLLHRVHTASGIFKTGTGPVCIDAFALTFYVGVPGLTSWTCAWTSRLNYHSYSTERILMNNFLLHSWYSDGIGA